jgi:hypothetical protein
MCLGLVADGHELFDFSDQFLDAGDVATSDGPLGDDPKSALHMIESG